MSQIVIKCSDPIYPIQETCLEIFPGKLIWFGTDESCDIVLDKDNGDVYPEHKVDPIVQTNNALV